MANPGPSTTVTVNTQAVTAPIQTPQNQQNAGPVQGTNAYRLLAVARAVPLGVATDAAVMPLINTLYYAVDKVVVTNGQNAGVASSLTTGGIGIFSTSAKGGVTICTPTSFVTLTAVNMVFNPPVATPASGTAQIATSGGGSALYVNVASVMTGATCDVFIYGWDWT